MHQQYWHNIGPVGFTIHLPLIFTPEKKALKPLCRAQLEAKRLTIWKGMNGSSIEHHIGCLKLPDR